MRLLKYFTEDGMTSPDIAKFEPKIGMTRRFGKSKKVGIGIGLGKRLNRDINGKCPYLKHLTRRETK